MVLPKKLIIADVVWSVEVRKNIGKNTMGYCSPSHRKIVILKGMSDYDTLSTLIHEVLHAAEFTKNLKIKHALIHSLEAPITSVLYQLFNIRS